MKKMYYPLYAIIIALFCFSVANAQDRLWFTANVGATDNHVLHNIDMDGALDEVAMLFQANIVHYGKEPLRLIQCANGEVVGLNMGGGANGLGTLFKITADGFVKIHDFSIGNARSITEGKDGYIYGIGREAPNRGFIFRIKPDGSGYQQQRFIQYAFEPSGIMTTSDGEIVGVTPYIIYKFKTDMSGITVIHTYTKATGIQGHGILLQGMDGYLYGTTRTGGSLNYGVVYKLKPTGEDYQVLVDFKGSNGAWPDPGLVQDEVGNIFGTTSRGGAYNSFLFTVNGDGTGFQKLWTFQDGRYDDRTPMVLDGDGNLYGVDIFRKIFKFNIASRTMTQFTLSSLVGGLVKNIAIIRSMAPSTVIIDPKNNSTDASVVGNLHFSPANGAVSQTVEISTSSDFSNSKVIRASPVVSVGSLKYSTTYYVRAKSTFWPDGWGPITSFTTHAAEKNCWVSNPANGATNVNAPTVKVTGNQVTWAKIYTVELNTSPDFSGASLVKTSSVEGQRTFTFDDLSLSTTYYARLKTDVSGYGKITSFTTRAETFVTAAPVSGTTDVDPVILEIETGEIPQAKRYTLQLSTNADFSGTPQTYISYADFQRTFIVKDLLYDTTYYARVKSNISTGYGPVTNFTTREQITSMRLWGVTNSGGAGGDGTIFSFSIDSMKFTKHYEFEAADATSYERLHGSLTVAPGNGFYGHSGSPATSGSSGSLFTLDRAGNVNFHGNMNLRSVDLLLASDNKIYCTDETRTGGPEILVNGYLARIDAEQNTITTIHTFNEWSQGHSPWGALAELDGYFYGVTGIGGVEGRGVYYRIKPDGSGYEVLYHFYSSGDVRVPNTELIYGNDGYFYGTTRHGGVADAGTLFKIKVDGSNFVKLFEFTPANGITPEGKLLKHNGVLYGTTTRGGDAGYGVVFRINRDGTGYTKLHQFLNNDGNNPIGGLVTDKKGNLWGMTRIGGYYNRGTLYTVRTNGRGFTVLQAFSEQSGGNPDGSLVLLEDIQPASGAMLAATSTEDFQVDIHPNPSVNNFSVNFTSANEEEIQIQVTDLRGEVVFTDKGFSNQSMRLGDNFKQGIYIMKIIRGKEITMRRIVKK